jgi:hypothetical protein
MKRCHPQRSNFAVEGPLQYGQFNCRCREFSRELDHRENALQSFDCARLRFAKSRFAQDDSF